MSSKAKNKATTPAQNSNSIDEAIQAFLQSGGEITQVKTGVSGVSNLSGPRHISLGKKN